MQLAPKASGSSRKAESSITLKFVNFTQNNAAKTPPAPMIQHQVEQTPQPASKVQQQRDESPLPPLKPYTYRPLTTPNEIRLVEILPGNEDAPICCKIAHHDVRDKTLAYTALSYTWGDPGEISRIACESLSAEIYLTVTKNCYLAMRRLRNRYTSKLVWIDAICIHQESISERNHQVGIMDRIYAEAFRTVVYLGEEEDDSELGISIIRSISVPRGVNPNLSFPMNKDCLSKLLDRPWCNRIWVLQEVFVSKSTTVICGPSEVSWEKMTNLSKIMERYQGDFDWPYIPCVLSLTEGYREKRWTLWELLCHTRQCASSDPRDKLFALSAMISDKQRYKIEPDYGMAEKDVFIDLALRLFETGGLDFLLAAQYFPSDLDLPDWVPDWSLRFGMEYINEIKPHERAGGASSIATAGVVELQSLYNYDVPNPKRLILKVRAIRLGEIKDVSDVQELYGPGWRERLAGISYIPKGVRLRKGVKKEVHDESSLQDTCCTCCPFIQQGTWSDINWRTITAGKAGNKVPTREEQISQNHPLIMRTMHGCKRFTTKCVYLGRTPTDARRGDIVCLFLGAVAPCILRQHGGFWLLVGGYAYLDGVMGGEAVATLTEEECHAASPAAPLIDVLMW